MRTVITPILVALISALVAAAPQPAPQRRTSETALDRYVTAPDSRFAWKVLRELPVEGVTATLLEMTSQQWLTEKEVERRASSSRADPNAAGRDRLSLPKYPKPKRGSGR